MDSHMWMSIITAILTFLIAFLTYLFRMMHELDKKQAVTENQISHLLKLAEDLSEKIEHLSNKGRR